MANLKKAHMILGLAASTATILTLLLTLAVIFFPEKLNEMTSTFTGPPERTSAGTLRGTYVESQVQIFLYASGLVVLLAGAGLGAAYHWSSAASAGSVAAGRGKIGWLKFALASFPAMLTILLGIYLPRAVFQPTNEEELSRQFFLGAWALRSLLGGLVLGVTYLLVACILAYIGLVLFVQLRRSLKLRKFHRQLES